MESDLLQNIEKLHTTDLGKMRIRRNLSLDTEDAVGWCREKILNPQAQISRNGKNWYVETEDCVITVNAASYTIITAHKRRKEKGKSGWKKVIFLDIDGVLNANPQNGGHHGEICDKAFIDADKAALLGNLAARTSAALVLHSGWKFWFDEHLCPTREEAGNLVELLAQNGMSIQDVTPDFTTEEIRKTKKFSLVKAKEIKAWLGEHPEVEQWIVLDDLCLHDEEVEAHQIKTDQEKGLTEEDIEAGIRMLGGFSGETAGSGSRGQSMDRSMERTDGDIVIREIRYGDYTGLMELYMQLHNNPMPEKTERIEKIWKTVLEDARHHIIVAEEDGKIVSSCVCIIVPNLTHGQCPYALVENVITDAGHRKRGLASKCLDHAKRIAQREDCYKMMLLTGSKEESTLHFYEQAGYNRKDKTAFIQWL